MSEAAANDVTIRQGPRVGDAFGALLLACLEGGAGSGITLEFIERDDGYLDSMDAAGYFASPVQWDPLDHWLCDRARGRVLDIGSGAGRAALHLQECGLDVVALDISPLASEVCRRRGVRQVFTGTVTDLAQAHEARFDTFLLLGNNLGLLGGATQAPGFLATLAKLAQPHAIALGRGRDPYHTENTLHLGYHARNRTLGRMGGQIRMRVRHRDLATEWFDYLFTTLDELQTLLHGTAWTVEEHERQAAGPGYAVQLRHR
ncbi:MAG: class I SAM-dependent methyltransferase [Chloroflexota bacterium]